MTYLSPSRQFLSAYIQALRDVGITIPVLTTGYNDGATDDYIFLHIENNDASSKNTNQFDIDVYVEIISINKTSISSNLDIEEKVLSLIRKQSLLPMNDFILNSCSFIGSATNQAVTENRRYFQNTLRLMYKLNKK